MLRNQTNSIVIKPKMPKVMVVMLTGLVVACLVAGVAGAYYFGHWQMEEQLAGAQKRLADQTKRNQVLNEQFEQLQASYTKLKRQLNIDDSVYSEMRRQLDQSNALLGDLRGELAFYRSIISPEDGKQGVRVQEFTIRPTPQAETFAYKLVLIQTLQQGEELSGTVSLTIKGETDGEPEVIEFPGPGRERLEVRFKYFQSLTGTLELPRSFKPLQVRVDLAASDRHALIEERWYPWREVMAAKAS